MTAPADIDATCRPCLRDPIPEIADAARFLALADSQSAVTAPPSPVTSVRIGSTDA